MLPDITKLPWKNIILHSIIHTRNNFILWLALLERLAIVDRLANYGITVDMSYAFYHNAMETHDPLYFKCPVTSGLWCKLLS